MGRRVDILVEGNAVSQSISPNVLPIVQTPNGNIYQFRINNQSDPSYVKSTDGGITFGLNVFIKQTSTNIFSIWYDRWSGIDSGKVHAVWVESTGSDVYYANIDTENNDTISTPVLIFDGTTTGSAALSISRARGGNLVIVYMVNNSGGQDGARKSTDGGATWDVISNPAEQSASDQWILLPGWNADNQDMQLFFLDATVSQQITVKRYDDSEDTWSEELIYTAISFINGNGFPNFAATPDLQNSRNIVIGWDAADIAGAKLQCFTVDDTTVTQLTSIIPSSVDDQWLASICINTDTQYWYVTYAGKSDGSEIVTASVNLYYRVSKDFGTTWGPEIRLTNFPQEILSVFGPLRFTGNLIVHYVNRRVIGNQNYSVNTLLNVGRSSHQLHGG